MIARLGRPRSLLMIAPHPDDETIGAHALMTRFRRQGLQVRVLVVSDGAGSHSNSPAWPRERLIRERRRETRTVLRAIGIDANDVAFLSFPDGRLQDHAAAVREAIRRAICALPKPAVALAPSRHDDHPDHRVVAAAAHHHPGVNWWTYPVWPAGQRLHGAHALPLSGQERLAKRLALRRYRTQTGRITDDPSGFTMTARQIAAFCRPQEIFAEMPW